MKFPQGHLIYTNIIKNYLKKIRLYKSLLLYLKFYVLYIVDCYLKFDISFYNSITSYRN